MNNLVQKILRYFFRGLLLTAPFFSTVYIFVLVFKWLDGLLNIQDLPGLGMAIIFVSVTILGALASSILLKPLTDLLNTAFERIPIVSLIYSSIKDLMNAFVGDNRKFKKRGGIS